MSIINYSVLGGFFDQLVRFLFRSYYRKDVAEVQLVKYEEVLSFKKEK